MNEGEKFARPNLEDKSEIERLNETLYSRTRYHEIKDERHPVKELETPDVKAGWDSPNIDEMLARERITTSDTPLLKKVFIFAFLFFVATIIVAGFVFLGGANFVSSKNVEVNVLGPSIASAGEPLELGISISNKNNADLELANFSIQYPQGSRSVSDTTDVLTFSKEDLGVIPAGAETSRNLQVVLLGSTGEVRQFKFSVEYRVKGSNATFYKEKVFDVVIGSAPVSVTIDSPRSITSGEEFNTTVSVTLNSPEVLKDVVLKAEYPYGYKANGSQPGASVDDNVWALGDLSPGTKKTVTIRGRLTGENEEERTFRFYVGVSDSVIASRGPKIVLSSLLNTIAISRPSIGLNITFNGESVSSSYVAPKGRSITASVRFQNNLPEKLLNPRLEARLSGQALDKSTISTVGNGFYDSLNSKITWELINSSGARELSPGESGVVTFNFASLSSETLSSSDDISVNLVLYGVPVGSPGGKSISVSETRSIKIASQVTLSAQALHSIGPFVNTGPIPPKAEEETTYTIVLNAGNTQGDIIPAIVTLRLGPGVSWRGASSVASEDISYNTSSNTVTWDLGTLSSGSGFSSSVREAAFQIALTPSTSQIGTVPILVSGINFLGEETSTRKEIKINLSPLSTRLSNDPSFIQGDDIVQR